MSEMKTKLTLSSYSRVNVTYFIVQILFPLTTKYIRIKFRFESFLVMQMLTLLNN